jgi:hypothetical protein
MINMPARDQLIADMAGRPSVPRASGDASGFGQDVVATVGDVT